MRKALILGTGSAQYDAIKVLKELGWWVIGCSYRHEGRGLELLDQFELVDIRDHGAVEQLGRREGIELLYSVGSDLAMLAIAAVAPRLGLPTFVSYDTARRMNNKLHYRDMLTAHGLSPVLYRRISGRADLEGWTHFPAIVKPADNQGSRGVFRANSMADVLAGLDDSLRQSRSGDAIIEEFLDGAELSVNAFVLDSEVIFNEVSDRLVVPGSPKGIFPRGHGVPSEWCVGEDLRQTKEMVERAIAVTGIQSGPVYFQVRLSDDGPRILEATPRLDGCHVWRILKMVYGADLLDASFKWLTGAAEAIDLKVRMDMGRHRKMFFLCPTGATFHKADYPLPEKAFLPDYYYHDGEPVLPIHGTMEKVVYYFEKE